MRDNTSKALMRQCYALGCRYFIFGLLSSGRPGQMMLRQIEIKELVKNIPFLKAMNAGSPSSEQWRWIMEERDRELYHKDDDSIEPRDTPMWPAGKSEGVRHYMPHHVYIKPDNTKVPLHGLVLLDDLTRYQVDRLISHVHRLAVLVETSPDNFQAWIKFPVQLDTAERTSIAAFLAWHYGGDMGCAHGTHSGRAAGFTNCKPKYLDRGGSAGFFPFVVCHYRETTGEAIRPDIAARIRAAAARESKALIAAHRARQRAKQNTTKGDVHGQT